MKKWVVLSSDAESVRNIIKSTDLAPLTAEVMSARGYNDIDSLALVILDSKENMTVFEKNMERGVKVLE